MQLSMPTVRFQDLISKANKGCSNNKMIPVTGLMGMSLRNNTLTLKTTDGRNFLTVIEKDVQGDNFDVVVSTELFIKLVMKMTSEKIVVELDAENKSLIVKGNGTYNVQLPLEGDGELIRWPRMNDVGESVSQVYKTKPAGFRKAVSTNKSALATTLEIAALNKYFVEDGRVVTCDSIVVCESKETILRNRVLLDQSFMDLISLFPDDEVEVEVFSNGVKVVGKSMELTGRLTEEVGSYPIDALHTYFETKFGYTCKVNRSSMLSSLGRLDLFVEVNDEKSLLVNFTEKGIILKSKRGSATEFLPYEEALSLQPGQEQITPTYTINLDKLSETLSSQSEVNVIIGYGDSSALKIYSGTLTHIVSLVGGQ